MIFAKNTDYIPEHNLQLFFILDWDCVLFDVGTEVLYAKEIDVRFLKELNTTRRRHREQYRYSSTNS
jgi:hypothetical protein